MDLTQRLLDLYACKKGQVGRYPVSSIWAICNGYKSVEDYFFGEPIEFDAAIRMSNGVWKHAQIQELLDTKIFEIEKKIAWMPETADFEIVGKCDFIDKAENGLIYEIKTSEKLLTMKPWHEWQGKIYCSLFKREKCFILQPLIDYPIKERERLVLKTIGVTERDEIWFKSVVKKLTSFHKKLLEFEEKYKKELQCKLPI